MRYCILSVDDFEITRSELYNILKNLNLTILNVRDEKEALAVLEERKDSIHAIVWTINTADFECFENIRQLRANEAYRKIPIAILSKFADKKHIIKAIEAGAVEYIAKPYDEAIVVMKICRLLGIPSEKVVENILEEDIVTFDFNEMLVRELKAASRGNFPLSLVMGRILDSDTFHDVEDDVDEFIAVVMRAIKTRMRETDMVFHFGKRAFVAILPFTEQENLKEVYIKIQDIFHTHSVVKQKNKGYEMVLAGVTMPDDGKIRENLIELLEERMENCIKEKIDQQNEVPATP